MKLLFLITKPAGLTIQKLRHFGIYLEKNQLFLKLFCNLLDKSDIFLKRYHFLLQFPSVVWRSLSGFSGIDLNKIAELTATAEYVEDNKRKAKVDEIAACIDRWLESTRQYHWNFLVRLRQKASRLCFLLNRREGTFLVGKRTISSCTFFFFFFSE